MAANYQQYLKIFASQCNGTPVSDTPDRIVSHVYGWGPWTELLGKGTGCSSTANLLENTPGYMANDYDLYGKVKLEFDKLNYGTYPNAPYVFNPWVQFIHGDAILPDQLGMPGVYAYSVDDAVGNLNVEAEGYIIDIGSTKHLENQTRATPPLSIQLGYSSEAQFKFETYGVCGNAPSQQKPVNPANPQFIVSATAPQNCPVFLTDNENPPQVYTFKVLKPPPYTVIPQADVRKNLATWSDGNGRPTQYNTTSVIDCSGNTSQLTRAWCCTLLPGSGAGVFAYSSPEVPPTAHQLLSNNVVTMGAVPPNTANAMTCSMGH